MAVLVMLLATLFLWGAPGTSSFESGTATVTPAARVPAVTGLSAASAVRRVRNVGLVPAQARCRAEASAWRVKSQKPAAGTSVPRGARVTLQLVPTQGHTPCNAYSGPLP
jgi:beta-lactam-binding protein with PASTA domain